LDTGLSQGKANFRLQKNGYNSLESLSEAGPLKIFFRQFSNFFIILLFAASAISYFAEGPFQSLILIIIIFVNVTLGFFQEYKAERALSSLKETFHSKAKVMRYGKVRLIDSRELVLGDIVLFEAGDKIPADLRLIEEESLRVNESSLTGESVPVSKNAKTLPMDTTLADRKNMLFCSTIIVAGRGVGVVTATSKETEFGKIAKLVTKEEDKTSLEKQVAYLAKNLTLIAVAFSLVIFLLGWFRNFEILELLTFTIALLVAVVPESLPTAISLSLAIGVSRMAGKKAIVRKLSVVETLGTTNIIVTDKTGTLTNNELEIDKIIAFENGKFLTEEEGKNEERQLSLLLHALACSNVSLAKEERKIGDPVEIAIVQKIDDSKKLDQFIEKGYERLFEIPFDSDKKFMAVLVKSDGKKSLIAKGMPEKVIDFCILKEKEREVILLEVHKLSSMGYKVIALSDKHLGTLKSSALKDMKFRGLLALIDEPSAGVKEAIARTISAGIRPVIITGDHPETARFVAEKIGLSIKDDEIMTGADLQLKRGRAFDECLRNVKIFARATPQDKIQIVQSLQRLGYSVAMTGDGVNDAPALKQAQVGISMGIKGTDIAKDSADIVLADDKYSTIVAAVEYGRTIYDSIKNTIVFLLSGNFIEISLVTVSFLIGLPLPLTALQILWINLITEGLPAMALSFEKPSPNVLRQGPRSISLDTFKGSFVYAAKIAMSLFITSFGLYLWGLQFSTVKAKTIVFCFIVFAELVNVLSIRSRDRIWRNPLEFFENKYLTGFILIAFSLQLAIFTPFIAEIFGIVPLGASDIGLLSGAVIINFIVAELVHAGHDRRSSLLTK